MEELYTLEKEVGRGSYGVVFEGRIAKTGQRVAVKRLSCKNAECIELYLQELWAMKVTAQNHANVIALHSCLLQTGKRSLKPLKKGKLPLHLVESVLKGTVVETLPHGQETGSRPDSGRRAKSESRLQDKTNTLPSNASKSQMPTNRPGKRSSWREDEQPLSYCALWLVMEYCDGGDLNHYLLSRPPDAQRNHDVVQQLSSAVAFLHHLGIIHRDLKPDNVLVSIKPNGPVFKVADFGLSKMSEGLLDGNVTRKHFSSTCGSDFYMAPEVWGGLPYSAPADIFSLGVMFWAVLERITFLEEGTTQEQLGAYVCKGRWLMPLGEALWENADLQLCIPIKSKRATPLPPPPGPATCSLLFHMLASDPDSRPPADQLESGLRAALREDSC
ncbi:serine/threonine-protein kinase pdik1l-B-like [Nerophis ophidion]|uniref:serine/threonine-protein kinase pdik1l-B-like n=1 Tax=Nerophis ophidion TaxID=159077 RepID=UPI002ADFB9A8|nr:serine/threonine-protein kinase pdik1l-B-like [Nerophis ophidion]XP_061742528.1 serine/threonine-protein kinase pdik1l-B-like [Nerophis ophidion]XP_061742529.1 serine/threonine-protein kinase pdik1l-B-like [Nerophis ophidion]XP_061742530.1 serine/threonine-protein kinase pdik1l-B-like [Nerophis ophidion]XP_061742531.1 serine/threonine-protein kinase pdik1l-B-like [Nerophis ophidion]